MNATKTVIMLLFISLGLTGCKQKQAETNTYIIKGNIKGLADGTKVSLKKVKRRILESIMDTTVVSSTTAQNGTFQFTGAVEHPTLFTITVDTKQEDATTDDGRKYTPASPIIPVYVENKEITISTNVDDIPSGTNFTIKIGDINNYTASITGSKSHDLYMQYIKDLWFFEKETVKLWEEYTSESQSKSPISQKVALAEKMKANTNGKEQFMLDFIIANANNMVGLHVADNIFGFDLEKLIKVEKALSQAVNTNTTNISKNILERIAKDKIVAAGSSFKSFTLKTPEGKEVTLSDHIGKGKYVLLEFWASWCGPCRADIPHLKEVYGLYNPEGFEIISISQDAKHEEWIKALDEEQMPWMQLSDGKAQQSEITQTYRIYGIPTCILIDPTGKIVTRNFRGSFMDAGLIDIYGNKFGDKY